MSTEEAKPPSELALNAGMQLTVAELRELAGNHKEDPLARRVFLDVLGGLVQARHAKQLEDEPQPHDYEGA